MTELFLIRTEVERLLLLIINSKPTKNISMTPKYTLLHTHTAFYHKEKLVNLKTRKSMTVVPH